jgi:peptidoglycan/LPS O-acetylase OafA/YrhL
MFRNQLQKNEASVREIEQLDALTSLRFCAAFAVMLYHVQFALPLSVGLPLLPDGWLGVNFFFILSGFILSHVYAGPHFVLTEFLRRRVARILPMHYLTLFVFCLFFFRSWGNDLHDKVNSVMANLFLVHAFFSGPLFNLGCNAVSWTISVEMFFYSLFPILRQGRRYLWVFAFYILGFLFLSHRISDVLTSAFPDFFFFNPFSRLLEFTCGMALYAAFQKWRLTYALSSLAQLGSIVALFLLAPTTSSLPLYLRDLILLIPFSCVILSFAWNGWLSRLAAWRGFVLLGEASFSLYMIHHMYFKFIDDVLSRHMGQKTALVFSLSTAILLSVVFFLIFESPMRRILSGKKALCTTPSSAGDDGKIESAPSSNMGS